MEGRGFSDLYRNTSEEIFLRSYMESTVGVSVPTTIDVLGFKNLSQSFRTDSEELFKSWLTNGENNGFNSPSIAHRTRSRRISTEMTNLTSQQHAGVLQNKRSNDNATPQNDGMAVGFSGNTNHNSIRNSVEKGLQASELYMAKAWFHSPQSMTRSRSSELRRRYVAMQSSQTTIGLEALQNASTRVINVENQDYAYSNGFINATNHNFNYPNGLNAHSSASIIPTQVDSFISPSNSSSSTFNAAPMGGEIDKVSSLVSLLKGTLERKKLGKQVIKEDDNFIFSANFKMGQEYPIHEEPSVYPKDCEVVEMIGASIDHDLEEFVNSANPIQSSKVSQEPSQSESSTVAPVVSSGFDTCDGPANSGQALSASESSKKQCTNRSSENGSRAKDIRERIIGSLKDGKKRGSLQRHGSVTSAISGDKEDPTKKRRVERSRKMAEAKERNLTPIIPSDMQSVLKRCEMLEKEVRSLKLNLSFMNRKDSEQTKQIEDLQKQNEELIEEKECLVEEINRIVSENAKIQ